jgi:alanyl aminopeptidase
VENHHLRVRGCRRTLLARIAVGPWDVVDGPVLEATRVRSRRTARRPDPGRHRPQLKWILEQTPATVKFYEEYTNQPYPFGQARICSAHRIFPPARWKTPG